MEPLSNSIAFVDVALWECIPFLDLLAKSVIILVPFSSQYRFGLHYDSHSFTLVFVRLHSYVSIINYTINVLTIPGVAKVLDSPSHFSKFEIKYIFKRYAKRVLKITETIFIGNIQIKVQNICIEFTH